MAQVSQNAVGIQLGRTTGQTVTLRLLGLNGYTRVFSSGGYLKVSPFQVENGNADDPATHSAPHSLNAWEGYTQTQLNNGDDLEITAEGYGEVDLAWIRPSGFTRDLANVTQTVFWQDMGTSLDLSVNPFDGGSSADAGDGTTYTITGLTEGHYYAIGVKVEWDDSVTVHTLSDSGAYDFRAGETPLTGAGAGIASDEVFGDTPDFSSLIQTTDEATCSVPDDVNLRLTVNMEGPSTGELQEDKNGGGWSTIDSSVGAGTTQINLLRSSGDTWKYRIRYNDVGGGSPGPYSVERSILASCILP